VTIRRLLLTAAATLVAHGASGGNDANRLFETKLSPEEKIEQALSRLTFGARSGDVEEVRKLGVEKWIELQLHPERIPENPILETRLKPFETIRMDVADIIKQYSPQRIQGAMMAAPRMNELLPGDQYRKVFNGTAEERREAIMALDPEKRSQVLALVPDNVVEGLPELKRERELARKKQNEERQAELRRRRPPLSDLLNPDQREIALKGTVEQRAALFASLDADKLEKVAAVLPPNALAGQPDLRRMSMMTRGAPMLVVGDDLREAKLYRAIYSNRQLEEVLTDFWFNHFNVYEAKGQPDRYLLPAYERDAIRPHALGKFKDLLLAVARHPAMLYYLDNWESMSPDVFQVGPFADGPFGGRPAFARQAHGLNENYGRELLELHTLGVNGGYTQQDVIAVARCFTGWTIRQPNQNPEFVFAAFMHDSGEKTVLGHKIPAGGEESDGFEVIDILAHHPSTARFISTKLARHFVADDPPPTLIDAMARTFTKTDGDLRAVMETMFTSRELFSKGAWQSKIKSPLEMVVSAVRAVDADALDPFLLQQNVADMGEPLYSKEAPTGYKDGADSWLSTANVLARIRFADALVNENVQGVKVDLARFSGKDHAQIARDLLGREPSAQTMTAIDKGLEANQLNSGIVYCRDCKDSGTVASLVISSPEFQRR
jgi:uncharacterized protein (DUF1800 family)